MIYPFKESRIVLKIPASCTSNWNLSPARQGKLLLSIAAHVTTILFSQTAFGGTSGTIKKNPDS